MLKNPSVKIFVSILILFFIYLFLNFLYIKNNSFKNFISLYPKIQKTVFATPALLELQEKITSLSEKKIIIRPSYLERKIYKTQFLNFNEIKYPLNSYIYTGKFMKAVAFIEFYKKNLFVVSGIGEISYILDEDILEFQNKRLNISSNIKDIIKDESFYDYENQISKSSEFNSVSDILIHNDFIYLSLT